MSWSAAQYTKFEAERNRPIHDLLAHVAPEGATAVDLGCGPGNSTALLRAHLPGASVSGLDSSADMIAQARQRLPGITFTLGDIAGWDAPAGSVDVILSNAALQWVGDHAGLLPSLAARLAPGGRLAVQMPDNLEEPAHVLMREAAAAGPWATRLAGAARPMDSRHSPDWYYRVLRACGVAVDIWRTTYHHPLAGGPAAVVEWFKGSALRPFLAPLAAAEQAEFLGGYQTAIAAAYPAQPDGSVLLPFPRLFFVATRAG